MVWVRLPSRAEFTADCRSVARIWQFGKKTKNMAGSCGFKQQNQKSEVNFRSCEMWQRNLIQNFFLKNKNYISDLFTRFVGAKRKLGTVLTVIWSEIANSASQINQILSASPLITANSFNLKLTVNSTVNSTVGSSLALRSGYNPKTVDQSVCATSLGIKLHGDWGPSCKWIKFVIMVPRWPALQKANGSLRTASTSNKSERKTKTFGKTTHRKNTADRWKLEGGANGIHQYKYILYFYKAARSWELNWILFFDLVVF